jgi:hypothetical protein
MCVFVIDNLEPKHCPNLNVQICSDWDGIWHNNKYNGLKVQKDIGNMSLVFNNSKTDQN